MVAVTAHRSPPRILNSAIQAERRSATSAGRTIWDYGAAVAASPVQLKQFDRAIGALHDQIAVANASIFGDPVPVRLVQRQATVDDDAATIEADGVDAAGAGSEESTKGSDEDARELAPAAEHDEAAAEGDDEAAARDDAEVAEAPVQARAGRIGRAEVVQRAARHGVSSGRSGVPHARVVQQAFGRHDVSGVGAVVGGRGREACDAMSAEAYASGDAVVFREAPSLHTVAHELAHVVQQRRGVSLAGGVGRAGDRHEREADAIADHVVAGRSVEAMLGSPAGHGGAPGVQQQAVQRAPAKRPVAPAKRPVAPRAPAKPRYVAPSAAKAPARTASLASVQAAHRLEQALASGRANLAQVEAKAQQMRRLWQATLNSQSQLSKQAQYLQQQVNKADGLIAFNTTLTNWIGSFDTVLSLADQAKTMVTSITSMVQAGKRTKSAIMGAAKQLKSQSPNQQKLERAVKAVGKQGQTAYKQGQASVKGANQMAGTFANVDGILRNATQAPDGAQAQRELVAMLKELNIQELFKDKAKLKDKLLRLGIKGGANVQRMAAAASHAELTRRKAAAEAALADVRASLLHVTCVHRAVNHGLASLEHAVRTFRALR